MLYEYKIGDVVLFKRKHLYGKLINIYNKYVFGESKTNHSGIITDIIKQPTGWNIEISEAQVNGFVSNMYWGDSLDKSVSNGEIIVRRSIIPLINVKEECQKYIGAKYGFFDIFKIVLFWLTGFTGNYWTGANKVICSEVVARVLYDCSNKKIVMGYNPENNEQSEFNVPFDLITPMHLYLSKFLKTINL